MSIGTRCATVRRAALLPAVLIVSAWAIPTAPAAASHLPTGHTGLGARQPLAMSHARQALSLSQLPTSLAATIRQTLARQEQNDYRMQAQGTHYLAASPDQKMQTVFTATGPRLSGKGWTWGMRLVGLGRSQMEPVASGTMVAQGSQLRYRRGSLTEWYRNSASGLEQGFNLEARPAGSSREAITLQLGLSGNLRAQLERGGGTVDLLLPDGQRVLRYGGLAVHDAAGRSLPAHLELTGQRLRVVAQDRGAQYPVQIDPWTYQMQLDLGTNAAQTDYLGFSVALSSDGNTALLGADYRTVNGQKYAGAGEVFTRSGATWTYQTQLDLATGGDHLGFSVALSSDGNTALLGAPERIVNGQRYAGAGEVFTRSGATWTYQTQLDLGINAANGDNLGISVALSSDGSTALLGVRYRTVNGTKAGAGEVFTRSGTTWTYQAQLDLGTGAAAYDELGYSVAVSSDGNTALLGAYYRTVNGHSGAGAGEVFTRSGTTWTYQAQLDLGAGAAANDLLGISVAVSSDGNTALLGADQRTVKGQGLAGAGEVFTRSGATWTYQIQLDLGTSGDELGSSVALSSDGTIALLGAPDMTVNGQYAPGAGEVFTQSLSQTGVSNGTRASASVGGTGPNTPGSYSATASGASGSVTVATYPGNPTSATAPPNGRGYFDVKVSPGNSFSSVSIVDCNLGTGNTLYWFDGTTWKVSTPQSPNTPNSGCITLTVSSTSSPTLSQLTGTPFAAGTATGPTVARVSAAHASRQAGVLTLTWRVAHTKNVVGFNLYAGSQRLNAHLIPVHRSASYAFHTHWSGAGPYTLHLILRNGTVISLPIQ